MQQTFQKLVDPAIEAIQCIDQLTNTIPENFEDGQWRTTDQDGNTLLHIASMSYGPELISFLLYKVPPLAAMRNKNGHIPLEALQNQLECQRTRRSIFGRSWAVPDAFKGYDASSVACLAVLENTTASDLSNLSPQDIESVSSASNEEIRGVSRIDVAGIRETLRYKYGCTCGKCIGGFLSPRMKFALLCVSEIQHEDFDTFTDCTGPAWVDWNVDLLEFLPGLVRENLKTSKSMRQGFANMFSHFAKCGQGKIPTEGEILDYYRSHESEWPPVTMNYLQRGGSVGAVANTIFQRAMESDEWAGDWSHRDTFGDDIDKLVACRNDHEFGFVAGMCGYI